MKAAILTIGTEILFGQITNTNSVYISQELNNLGYDVMYHYTVGDNPKRLKEMIHTAFEDVDIVLTTGGLGPTQDDLTKETIADALGAKLVVDEATKERILEHYRKAGREPSHGWLKQAYVPEGSKVFKNTAGTAAGFALERDGKYIISVPGVPREMKTMFQEEVKPYLAAMQNAVIYYTLVKTFGLGESMLEDKMLPLINGQTDPTFATYAKEGESYLRIASKRPTFEEAKAAVDAALVETRKLLGHNIYSESGEELVEVVGKKLIAKKMSISCAESCTGGLFASTLTDVPGISEVFNRGLVTYTEEAKMDELGVKAETLEKYTVYSREVAVEMARGLQKKTGSDICVSVTGIAGPSGGTPEKPVGTMYMAATCGGKTYVREVRHRSTTRRDIRERTVLCMLFMVNNILDGVEDFVWNYPSSAPEEV